MPSQGPSDRSHRQNASRAVVNRPPSWINDTEAKLLVRNLPPGCDTLKVYQILKDVGTIVKIKINEASRSARFTEASVTFSPPPRDVSVVNNGIYLRNSSDGMVLHVNFAALPTDNFRHKSPIDSSKTFAEEIKVRATEITFGVMKLENTMLTLRTVKSTNAAPVEVVMNTRFKQVDIRFTIGSDQDSTSKTSSTSSSLSVQKVRLNFAQMGEMVEMKDELGRIALTIRADAPPLLFRQTRDIASTHEAGAMNWSEKQTWFRQTAINNTPQAGVDAVTQLQQSKAVVDAGRWITYCLVVDKPTAASGAFDEMHGVLRAYSVDIIQDKAMVFESGKPEHLWSWLDDPEAVDEAVPQLSEFSGLHELARETAHLSFEVRYQLEVCVSQGLLHECNITKHFLARLAEMEANEANKGRAVRLLEKVADGKERFYQPEDIFRRLLHHISIVPRKVPSYCAMIRSATVTPTTIYFASPVLETSNRVIRRYQHYEDSFLRVRFTDERYKGRVMSSDDSSMDEVYARVKRTMTNGIKVGDRHYEFLAFGNSQFRERGAYFFAPTSTLTAQDIRKWMGDFKHINVVAKYCSRIGQCLSTTRTTDLTVEIERCPDIERNGFNFTDGVGKISPFLAQMIAKEHGLPHSVSDCPSAFQFRLGGSKGVLAVDPSLTFRTVALRPSQDKFTAMQSRGLEIVRISQFSAAYLNVQIILVLSALGVTDDRFLVKMRHMLADFSHAMTSEKKALEMLNKTVDYNQMTIQLASMVVDGFMETEDPFMVSCLRLWRAWSIKYLKEKARIYVDDGAFILGVVDDKAVLRGYLNNAPRVSHQPSDAVPLPEIFLQVPISGSKGQWRVITGICTLSRSPSLHPGDVRVVRAVDVKALHHLRDCVVLPQLGDRDLANTCSGGDLDGDDYLVMWDKELLPQEWNHPPMEYTPPEPRKNPNEVTVDDMTSFFVTHMKHDNLGRIAVAHRYWADRQPEGVKDPRCLELAQLHSMAVDYAKTGVPAQVPKHLRVTQVPHWAEAKNRPCYHSNRVLGKLYDMVQRVALVPAWELKFDKRILDAYDLPKELLQGAREVKFEYDAAVRRIMAKFSIKSEFEIWTTFVMDHSDDINDFKFAETIGEAAHVLKESHQKLCYEKAGTTDKERDWSKMSPFVAAMYKVTAGELEAAQDDCKKKKLVGGRWLPFKEPTFDNMPLISFPWLFPGDLGRIANKRSGTRNDFGASFIGPRRPPAKNVNTHLSDNDTPLELPPEVKIPEGVAHAGDALDQRREDKSLGDKEHGPSQRYDKNATRVGRPPVLSEELQTVEKVSDQAVASLSEDTKLSSTAAGSAQPVPAAESENVQLACNADDEEDEPGEVVTIDFGEKPSTLEQLERLTGS